MYDHNHNVEETLDRTALCQDSLSTCNWQDLPFPLSTLDLSAYCTRP